MFVTFEGIDGSGKTTQAALLERWARAQGHEVVAVREPGGTAIGERVRELLLDGPGLGDWTEAALFAAARAELAEHVIRPALSRGAWVVCDRYVDSSLAYQGVARGLGIESVRAVNLAVTGGLEPDVTFLLLLDPDVALARRGREARDRIEREDGEFVRRVDRGYRELADRYVDRIVVFDAARQAEELAELVRAEVASRMRAASEAVT
jgi:dTMP kinase